MITVNRKELYEKLKTLESVAKKSSVSLDYGRYIELSYSQMRLVLTWRGADEECIAEIPVIDRYAGSQNWIWGRTSTQVAIIPFTSMVVLVKPYSKLLLKKGDKGSTPAQKHLHLSLEILDSDLAALPGEDNYDKKKLSVVTYNADGVANGSFIDCYQGEVCPGVCSVPEGPDPEGPDPALYTFDKKVIIKWLELMIAGTSQDFSRPQLNRMLFDHDSKKVVSTDGHRIHIIDIANDFIPSSASNSDSVLMLPERSEGHISEGHISDLLQRNRAIMILAIAKSVYGDSLKFSFNKSVLTISSQELYSDRNWSDYTLKVKIERNGFDYTFPPYSHLERSAKADPKVEIALDEKGVKRLLEVVKGFHRMYRPREGKVVCLEINKKEMDVAGTFTILPVNDYLLEGISVYKENIEYLYISNGSGMPKEGISINSLFLEEAVKYFTLVKVGIPLDNLAPLIISNEKDVVIIMPVRK